MILEISKLLIKNKKVFKILLISFEKKGRKKTKNYKIINI